MGERWVLWPQGGDPTRLELFGSYSLTGLALSVEEPSLPLWPRPAVVEGYSHQAGGQDSLDRL